jgi:hypothetical protein
LQDTFLLKAYKSKNMNITTINKELSTNNFFNNSINHKVFQHIIRHSNELVYYDSFTNSVFAFNKLIYLFEDSGVNSSFKNNDSISLTIFLKSMKKTLSGELDKNTIQDLYQSGSFFLKNSIHDIIVTNDYFSLIEDNKNYFQSTSYKTKVDFLISLLVLNEYVSLKRTDYYQNLAESIKKIINYSNLEMYMPFYSKFNNSIIDFISNNIGYAEFKYYIHKMLKEFLNNLYMSKYSFVSVNQEIYIDYTLNYLIFEIKRRLLKYVELTMMHENIDDKMKMSLVNMIENEIK